MSLSLTTRSSGEVCFASVSGQLTLGPFLNKLPPELKIAISPQSVRALIVNLAEVSDIDSAGLGELVNIYKIATDRQLKLGLTGVNRRTRDMLALTHLDGLLPVYETEQDAETAVRSGL